MTINLAKDKKTSTNFCLNGVNRKVLRKFAATPAALQVNLLLFTRAPSKQVSVNIRECPSAETPVSCRLVKSDHKFRWYACLWMRLVHGRPPELAASE